MRFDSANFELLMVLFKRVIESAENLFSCTVTIRSFIFFCYFCYRVKLIAYVDFWLLNGLH